MKDTAFYANHLNQVSRSFSFCIARLEGDLRLHVGLSYLILRVLDTVEDSQWESKEEQKRSFLEFNQLLLASDVSPELCKQWISRFPSGLKQSERDLLNDFYFLLRDLNELPELVRQRIQSAALNMSRGMMHFQMGAGARSDFRLQSLGELNGYCFFVAGVVGELLTDLLQVQTEQMKSGLLVYEYAIQFGLFLQKINILKDQFQDEQEGRKLIHSRSEVLASLQDDANGAYNYLCAIPKAEVGYRLFCAWSLFLGLESLGWIEKSWVLRLLEKIPRSITIGLLGEIEGIISDDSALLKKFEGLRLAIPFSKKSSESNGKQWISAEQFFTLYTGKLGLQQITNLGILKN